MKSFEWLFSIVFSLILLTTINDNNKISTSRFATAGNGLNRDFNNKTIPPVAEEDEYIISPYLFRTPKKKIMFEFPYCPQNEIKTKHFLSKFHEFTATNSKPQLNGSRRRLRTYSR